MHSPECPHCTDVFKPRTDVSCFLPPVSEFIFLVDNKALDVLSQLAPDDTRPAFPYHPDLLGM